MNEKKENIYAILILFLIYILFIFLTYGKYGCLTYDCFREALIPEWILKGKVMYRDILNLYPPFAYYLNAFLFYIFGSKLSTLYGAAIVSTSVIWLCFYYIFKKISSVKTAFIATLTILFIFIFRIEDCNFACYFFPYSFSLLYALASIMIAFLSLILYRENNNVKFIYLAFLFTGLSSAFKLDYSAFILVLLGYIFCNLKSKKIIFNSICIFLIPILISCFIGYTQGIRLNDIYEYFRILNLWANNDYLKSFTAYYIPQFFNKQIIGQILLNFYWFIIFCLPIFLSLFFVIFFIEKSRYKIFLRILFYMLLLGIVIYFYFFIDLSGLWHNYWKLTHNDYYATFVFLSHFVLIFSIILYLVKKIKKQTLLSKEKLLYFLVVIAYSFTIRNYCGIYLNSLGNFSILAFWLVFIYILFEILPANIKLLNNKIYKEVISVTLIIYSVVFSYIHINNCKMLKNSISTPKGTIYYSARYKAAIETANNHIISEVLNQNKRILVFEESSYIHYLYDIPIMNEKMYSLHSHFIPVLGEDYIIDEIKKYKPDYIYTFNTPHGELSEFPYRIGSEIYRYILQNYNIVVEAPKYKFKQTKSEFYILTIFQRKM